MSETGATTAPAVSLADLETVRVTLQKLTPESETAVMVEQIRVLRELSAVLAAAEAMVAAAFVTARRAEQVAAGMPAKRVGQGIPLELGLARREAPNRAGRYAGFAGVLLRELPETFAALQAGLTTEWRATLIARETGWLSLEHRLAVDADLGPRLHALGDREVHAEAARLAYTLDPHGKIEQLRRATGGRRVTLMPADDGMTKLLATLPLVQGVAVIAALNRAADAARAAGEPRTRGQVMADTLVELITGQRTAEGVPLRLNLIITDHALFNTGGPQADEPATVSGFGPIPAPWTRDLITRTTTSETAETPAMVRIRRLFTDPAGRLTAMETANRAFTPAMAELVRLRDQWCTTPYCGAPIRHIDHTWPWAQGGPTSLTNAAGKCEACNYASQAPGWTITPMPDGTVRTTSPTGHDTSTGTRPRTPEACPPSAPPGSERHSSLERAHRRLLRHHRRSRPLRVTVPGLDFVKR